MIYTMFGVPIKEVISYEEATGAVRYVRNDGQIRASHISQLKADGGAREIIDAAKRTIKWVEVL
jgi:hypothetical protein